MLLMDGFGRSEDKTFIRDYRQDQQHIKTQIKIWFLIPFISLGSFSVLLLIFSLVGK